MRLLLLASIKRIELLKFGSALLPLLCWWLAAYPGLVSFDSVFTWKMSVEHEWNSVIPIAYLRLLELSDIKSSTALLTLIQVLLMATAIYSVIRHLSTQISNSTQIALSSLISFFPPIGILAVSVWKDSIFTSLWILCFTFIFDLSKKNQMRFSVKTLIAVGFLFFAVSAFRLNGFVVAFMSLLFPFLISKQNRLNKFGTTTAALLGIVLGFFLTNVYPNFHASSDSTRKANAIAPFYLDSALSWSSGTHFSNTQEELLNEILPKTQVVNYATCYGWDTLFPHFDSTPLWRNQNEILQIWQHALLTSPKEVLISRICRAEPDLTPYPINIANEPSKLIESLTYKGNWEYTNDYGLGPQGRFQHLSTAFKKIFLWSQESPHWIFFYWGGFWISIALFVALISRILDHTSGAINKITTTSVVMYAISIATTNVSPDFRYMMPGVILGLTMFLIYLAERLESLVRRLI